MIDQWGTTVYGHIRAGLVIRMACFALALSFVRVQIWFVSMDAHGEMSEGRGFLAPTFLAAFATIGFVGTFRDWSTVAPTRSEKFMANVRRGNRKDRSEGMNITFALATTVIIVGAFAASFLL